MKFRLISIILIFYSLVLFAEEIEVEGYDYKLDLPETWELLDAENLAQISFTDMDHVAIFQVISFPGDSFFTSKEIMEKIKKQLAADGESSRFLFNGQDSFFADFSFKAGTKPAKGHFIFINGTDYDYSLMAFTPAEYYDVYKASLLSALDSFSLNQEGLLLPGPVSQFFYPFPGPNPEPKKIRLEGRKLELKIDPDAEKVTQWVAEREATLLSAYSVGSMDAWERFYRILYRDSYSRLDDIASAVIGFYREQKLDDISIALKIMEWLQSFEYSRSNSVSDFLMPLTACSEMTGDCDSRALIFLIFLDHLNIDAVLLVSPVFKHSAVGINQKALKQQGALIPYKGEKYLYAELTAKVKIGQIAKDVSRLDAWTAFEVSY
ncbi:MAG: hypothetical protein JXR70_00960 [Spirochaetales bacterium]|nr:hypothetical protein [Spirochaetales bacterium]